MNLFQRFFRRKRSTKNHLLEMRHFMRVIAGPFDELFQFPDEETNNRAKEACRNGDSFRFFFNLEGQGLRGQFQAGSGCQFVRNAGSDVELL